MSSVFFALLAVSPNFRPRSHCTKADYRANLRAKPFTLLVSCVNTPIDYSVFRDLRLRVVRCSASCVNGARSNGQSSLALSIVENIFWLCNTCSSVFRAGCPLTFAAIFSSGAVPPALGVGGRYAALYLVARAV